MSKLCSKGYELILDGTDNFETRYLINDFAVKNSLPWIYTAAVGSYGVTLNVLPGETACLACIFPDPPQGAFETCDTAGILNSAVNLAASIAATEAMKLLVGAEEWLRRTLLSFDVWTNERAEVAADRPRAGCRACGEREFPHLCRRRPPAHYAVRPQLGADSRAPPSGRLGRDERTTASCTARFATTISS